MYLIFIQINYIVLVVIMIGDTYNHTHIYLLFFFLATPLYTLITNLPLTTHPIICLSNIPHSHPNLHSIIWCHTFIAINNILIDSMFIALSYMFHNELNYSTMMLIVQVYDLICPTWGEQSAISKTQQYFELLLSYALKW